MTHTRVERVVLIVEDGEPKLDAILSVVEEFDPALVVTRARSVASAVDILSSTSIDFAILDMSLPAFDIAATFESGGRPEGYGGRDLLRFLDDLQPDVKAVVLTQYEEFDETRAFGGVRDLTTISNELTEEFPENLLSVIYFSGRRGGWRGSLNKILSEVFDVN